MGVLRVVRNLVLGRPILAVFDVTRRCNQRCAFCNIPGGDGEEMDLARIARWAERLSRFGIGYVFIQGGEPTLRPDLIEIVDAFIARGVKPTVITNGLLLTPDLASQIAARRCNLAVSIDSLDPLTFSRIRGVDCLERVLENVRQASRVEGRRGNWAITTTITALSSAADVRRIEELARGLGFMHAVRPYVFVRGVAGRQDDALAYADDESRARVLEILTEARERARRDNYLAFLVYEEHIRWVRGAAMPACDAMRYSVLLRADGVLAPCIEYPELAVDLDGFERDFARHRQRIASCNATTPCFYNDAREVGIVWRNKWKVVSHLPAIIQQARRFGSFF